MSREAGTGARLTTPWAARYDQRSDITHAVNEGLDMLIVDAQIHLWNAGRWRSKRSLG